MMFFILKFQDNQGGTMDVKSGCGTDYMPDNGYHECGNKPGPF